MEYLEKKFDLRKLTGISEKAIAEHLKLYAGYVKQTNAILSQATNLIKNIETEYSGREMQRRFGFEFNGMRNHEIYFSLLEPGAQDLAENSQLKAVLTRQWGSFENWLGEFKKLASTRGPG